MSDDLKVSTNDEGVKVEGTIKVSSPRGFWFYTYWVIIITNLVAFVLNQMHLSTTTATAMGYKGWQHAGYSFLYALVLPVVQVAIIVRYFGMLTMSTKARLGWVPERVLVGILETIHNQLDHAINRAKERRSDGATEE